MWLALFVALLVCGGAPISAQTAPVVSAQGIGGSVAVPRTGPRDPQLPATGDARIRGRVIAADTGRPLRRAAVRISGAGIRSARSTMTDVDGQFEFTDLPAGTYTLNVSRAGYISMGYRQPRPNTSSRPLVLADHQRFDSADIALPRGGVITGRVLDEYGEPVAGVAVSAQRLQFVNGGRRPMPTGGFTSTNDLGEFRLFGLVPAEYYVSASWRAMSPADDSADRSGYAPTYYPSAPDMAAAQRLPVGSGETVSGIDIMLVPTRVARVAGFVLDLTGSPVKEGLVAASLRDVGFIGPPAANGFVRPDGSFVINGVAPGEYALRASLPTPGRPTTWENSAIAYITVNGADLSNVIVQVRQPATVSGRLVGDPAALALVRPGMTRLMVVPMGQTFGPPPPAPSIGDDYSFQVPALPGLVSMRATGTPPGVAIRAVRLNGRDVTTGFEMPSTPIDGLEVEMAMASARAVVIVTNGKNEPVADQDVLIFPQDENEWGAPPPGHGAGGRTDDKGQFQTPQLLAGPYYVAIIDPLENGQGNDPDLLRTFRTSAARVTLVEGETATVQVRRMER